MNTAVDDGLIRRNPCRIKRAGNEDSPERSVLTVPQVYALADAIGPRYRALILLATFASLRWAELASTACVAGALAVDGSDSIASVRLGASRASSWPAVATASDRAGTSRTVTVAPCSHSSHRRLRSRWISSLRVPLAPSRTVLVRDPGAHHS